MMMVLMTMSYIVGRQEKVKQKERYDCVTSMDENTVLIVPRTEVYDD